MRGGRRSERRERPACHKKKEKKGREGEKTVMGVCDGRIVLLLGRKGEEGRPRGQVQRRRGQDGWRVFVEPPGRRGKRTRLVRWGRGGDLVEDEFCGIQSRGQ